MDVETTELGNNDVVDTSNGIVDETDQNSAAVLKEFGVPEVADAGRVVDERVASLAAADPPLGADPSEPSAPNAGLPPGDTGPSVTDCGDGSDSFCCTTRPIPPNRRTALTTLATYASALRWIAIQKSSTTSTRN
jgi:hypothetical protein